MAEVYDLIKKTKTCWRWFGQLDKDGYGYYKVFNRRMHREIYEEYKGKIPNGLTLDHLCRVKNCVNPDHLEPVTIKENLLRSQTNLARFNTDKTHCKNGHEFTDKNIFRRKDRINRECRICRNTATRKWIINRG